MWIEYHLVRFCLVFVWFLNFYFPYIFYLSCGCLAVFSYVLYTWCIWELYYCVTCGHQCFSQSCIGNHCQLRGCISKLGDSRGRHCLEGAAPMDVGEFTHAPPAFPFKNGEDWDISHDGFTGFWTHPIETCAHVVLILQELSFLTGLTFRPGNMKSCVL